jgi:hypothetical protein
VTNSLWNQVAKTFAREQAALEDARTGYPRLRERIEALLASSKITEEDKRRILSYALVEVVQ